MEYQKKYNKNEIQNDKRSLGYKIDVFQESINQSISEYLVNFDYFTELLDNFGFVLCPAKDLQKCILKIQSVLLKNYIMKWKKILN